MPTKRKSLLGMIWGGANLSDFANGMMTTETDDILNAGNAALSGPDGKPDPAKVEAYNKALMAKQNYKPYREPGWIDSYFNPEMADYIGQKNAEYITNPAFAAQRRDDAVKSAVALRKAAANTDRDIFTQEQSHNPIFTSDSAYHANPQEYLLQKFAQHPGPWDESYGNQNTHAARARQLGSPLASAESEHYGLLNKLQENEQLYNLGFGERQANTLNAQTQNMLDEANTIRSYGLPFLRARGEAQQREGAYGVYPVQQAYDLQKVKNNLQTEQGIGSVPGRLSAIGNAQAQDELWRANHGGIHPGMVPDMPRIPVQNQSGGYDYQKVPFYQSKEMQSWQDSQEMQRRIQGGDKLGAVGEAVFGPPTSSVPASGPIQRSSIPNTGVRQPVTSGNKPHPLDRRDALVTPKVPDVTKEVYSGYENVVRNYTKDLSFNEASSVRDRVEDAIAEETLNYLGIRPSSIGTALLSRKPPQATLKEVAKDPDTAQKIHALTAEEHAMILATALKKAGLQ